MSTDSVFNPLHYILIPGGGTDRYILTLRSPVDGRRSAREIFQYRYFQFI